jgi:hypothetical protein
MGLCAGLAATPGLSNSFSMLLGHFCNVTTNPMQIMIGINKLVLSKISF